MNTSEKKVLVVSQREYSEVKGIVGSNDVLSSSVLILIWDGDEKRQNDCRLIIGRPRYRSKAGVILSPSLPGKAFQKLSQIAIAGRIPIVVPKWEGEREVRDWKGTLKALFRLTDD